MMRFYMINFKLTKTMILILLLWSTILFATTSENNPKDIVFYSQRGGASLLISGEFFKKTEIFPCIKKCREQYQKIILKRPSGKV